MSQSAAIEAGADPGAERTLGATLEEIEAAYVHDAHRLLRVAVAIVGDPSSADDVVQDTFAKAVRKRRSFSRAGALEAWLWRVCVNTALNRRRQYGRERSLQLRAEFTREAASQIEDTGLEPRIRAAVGALPERQRAAVFLRYYADLEYEKIAATLSIAPNTVGKMLHDARAKLRLAMEVAEDE
jgi:RNA polymerase sigma-70 factor, ECF subfamily